MDNVRLESYVVFLKLLFVVLFLTNPNAADSLVVCLYKMTGKIIRDSHNFE